jgi:ATP-dependent exoDNAse (exonuclease V) beta subunit
LEWVLSGKHDLREALRRGAIKEKLTTVEMDDLFALAHNIKGFLTRLDKFKQEHGVTEQAVERKFGLTIDLQPCDFWDNKTVFFRGVWDLCLKIQNKYLVIIDHKTGEEKELSTYEDQLKMYAIAGVRVFPGVVRVQAALNYLENEESVTWAAPQQIDAISSTLVPWFVKMIDAATEAAMSTEAKKGWWCKFCEHTGMCPLR